MFKSELLYHIISIFQELDGSYSVFGQGVDVETGSVELVGLGHYSSLEDARNDAELKAAESDCILVETLKGSAQKAVHVNDELLKGGV